MPDVWNDLTKAYGRKVVMGLHIDDNTLDAETNRQKTELARMIDGQRIGNERHGLDFGCGAGRFSGVLADSIHARVTAFDPSHELVALAPGHILVDYISATTEAFFAECFRNDTHFDAIMAFVVMGAPGLDLDYTASALSEILVPNGLLILVDHMPDVIPYGKWWRFRPRGLYESIFHEHGIDLKKIGSMMQLENELTVLAGRKSTIRGLDGT